MAKTTKKAARKAATKTARPAPEKSGKSGKTGKSSRTTTATVAAIALSRDGAWWNVSLSTKQRVRVAASAALGVRVRVGMRWTKSLESRIERLANEQRIYALALELLAKNPRLNKAQLAAQLGGDQGARAAVASLVSHGWL